MTFWGTGAELGIFDIIAGTIGVVGCLVCAIHYLRNRR